MHYVTKVKTTHSLNAKLRAVFMKCHTVLKIALNIAIIGVIFYVKIR